MPKPGQEGSENGNGKMKGRMNAICFYQVLGLAFTSRVYWAISLTVFSRGKLPSPIFSLRYSSFQLRRSFKTIPLAHRFTLRMTIIVPQVSQQHMFHVPWSPFQTGVSTVWAHSKQRIL